MNKDPDGRLCASVISSAEMCDRSLRYAAIDQDSAINSQTRFFAAASMVTNALGTLEVAQAAFMTNLSRGLEQHNQKMAEVIRSGSFLPGATPSQRDAAFVHSEQTIVQGRLDQLKADSPIGYSALIKGVNGLLNSRTFGQSGDPNFGRAIRIATKEVGGRSTLRVSRIVKHWGARRYVLRVLRLSTALAVESVGANDEHI